MTSPAQTQSATPEKIVIVVADGLDAAIVANACALLSLSVGAAYPALIGPDVLDQGGGVHAGICTLPVPVLHASAARLGELADADRPGVRVIGFTRTAASCHTYPEYIAAMAGTASAELDFLGLALAGPKKQVNSLTGSLPLLRA